MRKDILESHVLYELDEKPPAIVSAFAGFQHLLAMIGGILAAPFLIALGMGLSVEHSAYLIATALVASGLATYIQINRGGMLGAGLLSVQGTSFAFVGTMIFAYKSVAPFMTPEAALGAIFGSSAACAALMFILSFFVKELKNIITTNVTGVTIILIGVSLIQATLQNLLGVFNTAGGIEGDGAAHLGLAVSVFLVILIIATLGNALLRVGSITIGLLVGVLGALQMGIADFSGFMEGDFFFIPEFSRFPLSINLSLVLLIMPIFLVSAMESIGDITATNDLSGLKTGTHDYWLRVRGGIVATSFSSFVAALFCTFPVTTFSQNNGVIRLTGICSRHIGKYLAGFLVLLGCLPIVTAAFQRIPSEVIFGATLLMFILVVISGVRVVQVAEPKARDWVLVSLAILMGYTIPMYINLVPGLSPELVVLFQFPVSTGALIALLLELVIPAGDVDANA